MKLPAPPSPGSCAELPARLRALERGAGDAASAAAVHELRRHLGACAPCRQAHGARLAALEGLCALRSRQVPGGLLEDLKSRVLTQVRTPTAGRLTAGHGDAGGMSAAFLDAPASLARWRGVALAASVLLAVGAGLLASGRLSLMPARGTQDQDLRDALLPRLEARREPERGGASRSDDVLQPVMLPGRGMGGYFVGRPAASPGPAAPAKTAPAHVGPAAVRPKPVAPDRLAPETGD